MANIAKANNIGRIKNPISVVLDKLVVVDMKQVPIFKSVSYKPAINAGVIVTRHDCTSKLGVEFISLATKRFAVLARVINKVEVFGEEIRIQFGNVVPMIRAGFALSANRLNIILPKSLVPHRHVAKLGFSAIGMMPALVLGYAQSTTTLTIDGEGVKYFAAPTLASNSGTGCLCFGNGHDDSFYRVSMLPQAGKLENGENCWNPLRANAATAWPVTASANAKNAKDWAISSGATKELVERSTTRAWSPDRTVKPHEYATRKGRYSLVYGESHRSIWLNSDAITKRPYSGKLEALSQFDVKRPVMQALKNDAVKTFDRAVQTQFNNCQLRVVATSTTSLTLTTNGTATATNSQAYNAAVHKLMVDLIKERNIPPYLGDDYISLAWPSTFRPLKNDMETLHQYTPPGLGLIMSGEIGRYENTRFVEQSNILKGVNNDGVAWTNNKSDWMYIFGEDTVMEGITIPEEIRAKIPCQNDEVFAQVA